MYVLFALVLALVASHCRAYIGSPADVLGGGTREVLLGSGGAIGNAALITDEQLDKVVDFITAGCYTDPDLVPGALKKCIGTSANLLREVLEIIQSSVIGVYSSSSEPSRELIDQAWCFITGLNLISDNGTLNQPGVDYLIDSMKDSADLRIYVRDAIIACASQGSESHFMCFCLEKALLQKCRFVEQ